MNSVATLIGQPPSVVQDHLGPVLKHQRSADQQTDFYLHGPQYFAAVFPIAIAGIGSVFQQGRCVALRIVFDRPALQTASFVYTQQMAETLFTQVTGESAQWQPLATTRTSDELWHHASCLGSGVATTWKTVPPDNALASDIILYVDQRCNVVTAAAQSAEDRPAPSTARPVVVNANLTTAAAATAPRFPDVVGSPYEAEILKATSTYQLVAGYADGTFRPALAVTREQAIALLLRAMKLMMAEPMAIALPDVVATPPFADVPLTHRSVSQFYYAKQAGILVGDEHNRAYPDAALSRAGLMTIIRSGLLEVMRQQYGPTAQLEDGLTAIAPALAYTDLNGHWGATAIRELTRYGIATPMLERGLEFEPNAAANRDFTVAALVRMVEAERRDRPLAASDTASAGPFSDIANSPFQTAILTAARYGIVTGAPDGRFYPAQSLSREQAVVMLINAMQYRLPAQAMPIPTTLSEPPPFTDITGRTAALKIQFAKAAKLISGDGSGQFRPLDQLSRAQLMVLVHHGLSYIVRAELGRTVPLTTAIAPQEPPPVPFPDLASRHWAYPLIEDLRPSGIASADVTASDYRFNADRPARRDEATAIMVRLIETALTTTSAPSTDHPLHDPNPTPEVTFSDIAGNPYQAQIWIAANQYQLVSGFADGTFRPAVPTTREQAAIMLLGALQERIINEDLLLVPTTLTEPPFKDVAVNRWSAPRLALAKQIGLVAGDALGYFAPAAPLRRAQLMAIAHQALTYCVWQDFGRYIALDRVFNTEMVNTYNFVDIPDNHWAANILPVMSVLGLAQPQDFSQPNRFASDAPAHRDYAVAIAVRMVQLMYTEMPTPVATNGLQDLKDDPQQGVIRQAVYQYQLMPVPADGYFRSVALVDRATVATLVVNTLMQLISAPGVITLPEQLTSAPFPDVPIAHPAAAHIQVATAIDLMTREAVGRFAPGAGVTRAQLMLVILAALEFVAQVNYGAGVALTSVVDVASSAPPFTDVAAHPAAAAIAQLATLGIAQPRVAESRQFEPDVPARRNEAAVAMVRLRELPLR